MEHLRDLSADRLILIADALAKSAALTRDEQEVAAVFDVIEPHARRLGERGRSPGARRDVLKLIGNILLVRHRVSGRVAVEENLMSYGTAQILNDSMRWTD